MPSTHQSGQSTADCEVFPEIEAEIGEDPARFLDKPLAPDPHGDTTPMALAKARIRGIDKALVARYWLGHCVV